jgi:hypothetical protein
MSRRYVLAIAVLALVGVLAACARSGSPAPDPSSQPLPRSQNIIVTELLPGSELAGSFTVKGEARVWEATVQWEIEDGHNLLDHGFVTATQGAPEWGTFEIKTEYRNPSSPNGMIILFTTSAKDGSRQDVVMIPVKFDPSTVKKSGP